jgi:hypothetical protein
MEHGAKLRLRFNRLKWKGTQKSKAIVSNQTTSKQASKEERQIRGPSEANFVVRKRSKYISHHYHTQHATMQHAQRATKGTQRRGNV